MSQTSVKKTNTSKKKLTKCERVVKIRTNQSKKSHKLVKKLTNKKKKTQTNEKKPGTSK